MDDGWGSWIINVSYFYMRVLPPDGYEVISYREKGSTFLFLIFP